MLKHFISFGFKRLKYILLIVFILLTHLLIIAYLHDWNDNTSPIPILTKNFKTFNQQIHEIFDKDYVTPWHNGKLLQADIDRIYLLNTEFNSLINQVLVPEIYLSQHDDQAVNSEKQTDTENKRDSEEQTDSQKVRGSENQQENENQQNQQNKNKVPELIQYDPRITSSLLLKYLTDSLEFDKNLENLQIPFFDWSDYVDLSILNQYLIKPQKSRCEELFDFTTGNANRDKINEYIKPDQFCINDDEFDEVLNKIDDLTDLNSLGEFEKSRIELLKTKKLSTGFHIWKVGGRSPKDLKILQAKSYLHDFMPTPLSMVLLLPNEKNDMGGYKYFGNALKIPINQDPIGHKKLIDSNIFKNINKNNDGSLKDNVSGDVELDVKKNLDEFLDVIYKTNHKPNTEFRYEKKLTHDLFIDNSSDILNEISMNSEFSSSSSSSSSSKISSTSKASQSLFNLQYKRGLEISLDTPNAPKYFSEALVDKRTQMYELGSHHDWRFFNGWATFTPMQPPLLFGIAKAWFQFINQYKINSWIAHGSLLSWFWTGMAFPWDIDFDVQMPIQDLHYLCKNFNQSLIMDLGNDFRTHELRYSKYFLDCGTYISQRKRGNGNNNIDARFIDINSGIYIDITGLAVTDTIAPSRYNELLPEEYKRISKDLTIGEYKRNDHLKAYNCRNNHFQLLSNLSPMRLSFFEGQLTYTPNDYQSLLTNEYREKSMENKKFLLFTFIERYNLWVDTKNLISFVKKKYPAKSQSLRKYRTTNLIGKANPLSYITNEFESEDDYLEFIVQNPELFFEFLVIEEVGKFHKEELKLLSNKQLAKHLFFKDNKSSKSFNPIRHDFFSFISYMEDYNFVSLNQKLMSDIEQWKIVKIDPPEDDKDQNQDQVQEQDRPQDQSPDQSQTQENDKQTTSDEVKEGQKNGNGSPKPSPVILTKGQLDLPPLLNNNA